MPVPIKIGKSLSEEQMTDLKASLKVIIETPTSLMAINLTKPERMGIQSVADERLPYVQKTFDTLIPSYPILVQPFGNLDEAKADYTYLKQHLELKLLLLKALEVMSDHELAVGQRAYEFMRDFYLMAQRGAERSVPGADTVVDALSPLFEVVNPKTVMPENKG